MLQKYRGKLFCFSPPVMLATFALELVLALFAVWRYRLTLVTRLAVVTLLMLAIFQMAEYMVCGGLGLSGMAWARVGYVAITLLPPLGLHLALAIAGKKSYAVVSVGYALAAVYIAYFSLAGDIFTGSQCLGNYVIFQLGTSATQLYGAYYYSLIALTIGVCWYFSRQADARRKIALWAFILGYALFIVPTAVVNTVNPSTYAGIPSIMCGFAVLFAVVLATWVLPQIAQRRGMYSDSIDY